MRGNMGLFLGKRETDGKWVEGYLYPGIGQHKGKWFITVVDEYLSTSHTYAVIPETIREFTGLSDKTGKRIFENDIVKVDDDDEAYKIIYVYGAYRICDRHHRYSYTIHNDHNLTVIGNVYDNPELLKGD